MTKQNRDNGKKEREREKIVSSYSLYLSIIRRLSCFLNWYIFGLSFILSGRVFHMFTPLTDMHMCFRSMRAPDCRRFPLLLKLYLVPLSLNHFCMLLGSNLFLALYIIWAVLKSTRSRNLSDCNFKNKLFVCS